MGTLCNNVSYCDVDVAVYSGASFFSNMWQWVNLVCPMRSLVSMVWVLCVWSRISVSCFIYLSMFFVGSILSFLIFVVLELVVWCNSLGQLFH